MAVGVPGSRTPSAPELGSYSGSLHGAGKRVTLSLLLFLLSLLFPFLSVCDRDRA